MKKLVLKYLSMKKATIIICLVILAQFSIAQIKDLKELQLSFDYAYAQIPYEKIYLSTDKNLYLNSDTLFFQAFLTDPIFNRPIRGNSIAHVALLSKENRIIEKVILKLQDGMGSGYIVPQFELNTDEYILVAYSSLMKNYHSDFYFNKRIKYFNECVNEKNKESKLIVNLHAEGGCFVEGVKNNIGLEITNQKGDPVALNGILKNSLNSSLINVSTNKQGIGNFIINHVKGINYHIEFSHQNQLEKIDLPVFLDKGIALAMTSKLDFINTEIRFSKSFKKENALVHLLMHQANRLIYSETINLTDQKGFIYKFPKENLSHGLANLIILDENLNLVNERLFFVEKSPFVQKPQLTLNQKIYTPKGQLDAVLSLGSIENEPETALFSTSIIDKKIFDIYSKNEVNIVSHTYLTSELNDKVLDPNYYFSENGKGEINNMLITKNGTRIEWEKLISKIPVRKELFPKRTRLSIKAKATFRETGIPVPDSTLFNFYIYKYKTLFESYSQQDGKLEVGLLMDVIGDQKVFYHPIRKDDQLTGEVSLDIYSELPTISLNKLNGKANKPFTQHIFKGVKSTDNYPQLACNDYLLDYQKRSVLSKDIFQSYNFYLKQENDFSNDDDVSESFSFDHLNYTPDVIRELEDYRIFENMLTVTRELLPRVIIRKKKGKKKVIIDETYLRNGINETPLFIIDGFPTYNQDLYLNLNPSDIKTIEVISSLNQVAKFGYLGENGVLIVRSKPGKGLEKESQKVFKCIGYQESIIKSYPNYSKKTIETIPDYRSVIYWGPKTRSNTKGISELKPYLSDDISDFVITIQGIIMETGEPFQQEAVYKVSPGL